MLHTVVLSDIHLCESLPGDGAWMRFRQAQFAPDADFARFVSHVLSEVRGDSVTIVFNGDTFDFDAPPILAGEVVLQSSPPGEDECIARIDRILDDHQVLVDAVATLLAAGHRVVFTVGNHDAHLAWAGVQQRLRSRLVAAVSRSTPGRDDGAVSDRVLFRSWFHRTEDGVHVEHGHQYDDYCAFRSPGEPFTPDGRVVQPTMGSLSYRHLVTRMGYFNPYADMTFMLSVRDYAAHWARYYARSSHSLGMTWARGAVEIMRELVSSRPRRDDGVLSRTLRRANEETGATIQTLEQHASLFAAPVNEHAFRAARELWLDRVALAAAGVMGIAAASVAGPVAAAGVAAASVAAVAVYEQLVPKPPLDATYDHVERCQREIARIHGARAVVLGHTHKPYSHWIDGVLYANTGTWAPAYQDIACTIPLTDGRPVAWLRGDGDRVRGGLYLWRRGHLLEVHEQVPSALPAGGELVMG